jgi:hypothetical protein
MHQYRSRHTYNCKGDDEPKYYIIVTVNIVKQDYIAIDF